MQDYRGKKVVIMGLGLFGGGLGVTKYFCSLGADVLVTDMSSPEKLARSLEQLKQFDNVRFKLGSHEMNDFTSADLIIVNPAVPAESPYIEAARRAGVTLDTELNVFLRLCKSPVVAITGTNGKSTTTALIHNIVSLQNDKSLLGGNIGRSLLDVLDLTSPDTPVVLEVSSFQLENLRWLAKGPKVALITNISPNHLDRHKTLENYIEAKKAILDYQTQDDVAVINADDDAVVEMAKGCRARIVHFSLRRQVECGAFVRDGNIVVRTGSTEETVCPVHSLSLKGAHNCENALAAVAATRFFLWDRDAAVRALTTFPGLEHRLEFVRELNGIRYYNDSIATNPRSVVVALKSFSSPKVLIAGGFDKKLPFDEMITSIYDENVHTVVLVGETKGKIKADLDAEAMRRGRTVSTVIVDTFEDAVIESKRAARWGDCVLMSPGCASYGMFVNFEQRGTRFKDLVNSF